jgi:hypothetical protein
MSDIPLDGPRARLKGNGLIHLVGWELRNDGWWILYPHAYVHPHRRDNDAVAIEARWVPADQVEPLPGVDYSGLPRRDARTGPIT